MQRGLAVCLVLAAFASLATASHVKGAIDLDSLTFDKLVGKGTSVLVKFDKDYAYGEKEDAFKDLAAKVSAGSSDVLIASVGVQEYGDKLNEDLAERFAVSKESFPHYKLFSADGKSDPLDFKGEVRFDDLVRFLKSNVPNFYLALPGCIRELDKLAAEFMSTAGGGRNLKRQEAEQFVAKLETKPEQDSGKFYVLVMKKVTDKGDGFIESEIKRLNGMLESSSITEERKDLFKKRLNILPSFSGKKQDEL